MTHAACGVSAPDRGRNPDAICRDASGQKSDAPRFVDERGAPTSSRVVGTPRAVGEGVTPEHDERSVSEIQEKYAHA
jgi:hypothetical protein